MSAAPDAFPTLAEQLDVTARPAPPMRTLVVVLDGVHDRGALAGVPTEAPTISLGADESPATIGALREAVAAADRDLLVVSDPSLLGGDVVARMRTTMALDSACASVSVLADQPRALSGLPAAPVERPEPGVVLVSGDHLLLALDEADLLRLDGVDVVAPAPGTGVVADVLLCLERPGFVHRAVGASAVSASLSEARSSLRPRRRSPDTIVVDGRCLASSPAGTHVQVVNLVAGLLRAGADVSVLAPAEMHPAAERALHDVADGVPLITREHAAGCGVFHCPFNIGTLSGLRDCLAVGERLVVTQMDMIAARTAAYVGGPSAWRSFRDATAAILASADGVAFFSHHAAIDAASECDLDPYRAAVIELGVDHLGPDSPTTEMRPLGGRPYLLMMGNAYLHKNRVFALRLLRWLVEEQGWDGGLVFAGDHPRHGSSVPAERALLEGAPSLVGRVSDLEFVTSAEQAGLYRGAELVLFPSLYEGFGFVPFEAATFGTACIYAHRSSLRDLLPETGALPSFDLAEAGPFALRLLESVQAREAVVADVRAASTGLTWDRAAAGYRRLYERTLERGPRGVSRAVIGIGTGTPRLTEMEALVLDVYRRRRGFRAGVDAAIRLGGWAGRAARRPRRG
jgi:glycosyltransferase involved in cell wall biosynthesis